MDVEIVIESALKQGFDSDVVHAALIDAEIAAIETFIDQLNQSAVSSLRREVLRHLIRVAGDCETERALAILERALEIQHGEAVYVVREIGRIGNERALGLLHNSLDRGWKSLREYTAQEIIRVQYGGNNENALQDQSEHVRLTAVQALVDLADDRAVITALKDRSPSVRRIAAWYMGHKRVVDAVGALAECIRNESDIEAMRGAIWSLGVLHDPTTLPLIRRLCQHVDPMIAETAKDAIEHFRA